MNGARVDGLGSVGSVGENSSSAGRLVLDGLAGVLGDLDLVQESLRRDENGQLRSKKVIQERELTCSEARMGTSPMIFLIARKAAVMSVERDETERDASQPRSTSRSRGWVFERTINLSAVLSNNPKRSSEDLSRLDVSDGLEQLLGDGVPKGGELLDNLSAKVNDKRKDNDQRQLRRAGLRG